MTVGGGTTQETFAGHKNLLEKHSQFFASALNSNWKEGNDNHVTLEDDLAEAFDTFLKFLYSGKIFSIKDGDSTRHPGETYSHDKEWERLAYCWMLGEKLLSSSFKDAITDTIICKMQDTKMQDTRSWPLDLHGTVYQGSAGDRGLRRLLVDVAVWEWSDSNIYDVVKKNNAPQFVGDLAIALSKFRKAGLHGDAPFSKKDTCLYHDHGDATPCYKTTF